MKNELGLSQVEMFGKEEVLDNRVNVSSLIDYSNREVRLKPINRQQMVLRVVDIEELIPMDHDARAIWKFVGRLDLSGYYKEIKVVEGEAGRPAMDPQLMISLWIYSYSKGISSAREICRLCKDDPAYQWLTGLEPVNYHTISDFRVDNKETLEGLFIEVLGVLSAKGLITLERVMHDGSKIKASASADTFHREDTIWKHLELAREQVKLTSEASEEEVGIKVVKARERAAREKEWRLELALQELEKIRGNKSSTEDKREARVSETDPEARIMKQSDDGYAPSYNVQISTDSKEKIIVGVDVNQSSSDSESLVKGEEVIKKNMGKSPGQMVVDGGLISRENILAMNDKGVDLIGPMKDTTSASLGRLKKRDIDPAFYPQAFQYNVDSDSYTCPSGKVLLYEGKRKGIGYTEYQYRACVDDCQSCPHKQKCCPKNEVTGRAIVKRENDPVVREFIDKMKTEEAKAIYKERGAIAEFPNLWIKDKIKLRQFHLRGLYKVGIEILWVCLTYNIQQWIRLC